VATSATTAGKRLSRTSLRDFSPRLPDAEPDHDTPWHTVTLSAEEAPLPVLMRHALTLVGIGHGGPGEKVAWWASFRYKGYGASLAHQKFGVRLSVRGRLTEEQAGDLLTEMRRKLRSAVATVEELLTETTRDTLNIGAVTVVNQRNQLRRAYDYFRKRTTEPDVVEDVSESGVSDNGGFWSTYRSGQNVMSMNAFHDLVAAISAYLSCLEHELVLVLPFSDFDPTTDDLTRIIGDHWGQKWRRVLGHSDPEAVRLRGRLTAVVERWRNPYSHGGFEKGHGATVWVHMEGIGALPVGLSEIRDSPLFSFRPASETDVEGVFALFDDIDAYLVATKPHAMEWIAYGLDVRFDSEFRLEVSDCLRSDGDLKKMIEAQSERDDMVANMDF